LAAVGRRPWSVAVSRTLRGVKLSTTKVARPSAPSRSAQAISRTSTPPLPWAITIAGTRPAASFGSRKVPTTTAGRRLAPGEGEVPGGRPALEVDLAHAPVCESGGRGAPLPGRPGRGPPGQTDGRQQPREDDS